jgi:FkbM family methyltransferase
MLIPPKAILEALAIYNINLKGVLHIGAHDCEEIPFYLDALKLNLNNILWIDAIPNKVMEAIQRQIPNVFHAVITDKDDEEVIFNISNNGQSSSVLPFGTHSQEHPNIVYNNKLHLKSITINSFFERNGIDGKICNFWNFDIQGAELMALRGATNYLEYVDALYLEVNEKELYIGCGLIGEIDAFLAEHHFHRALTVMTPHGWGDALYMRDPIQNL